MDDKQRDRFREALDEKRQRDQERAEGQAAASASASASTNANEEQLSGTDETQVAQSARDKSSRHKKVTADKWNQ